MHPIWALSSLLFIAPAVTYLVIDNILGLKDGVMSDTLPLMEIEVEWKDTDVSGSLYCRG